MEHDTEVESEIMYTSAVQWPKLREALRVHTSRKDVSRADNDEWGGKVWDGVTDWFV